MAITTRRVTGPIVLPDGSVPRNGRVTYQLSGWDREDGEAVVMGPITVTLDEDGAFDADLWCTDTGENGRVYVGVVAWHDGTARRDLSITFDVPSGTGDLAFAPIWVVGDLPLSTQASALAQCLAAAAQTALDRVATGEDREAAEAWAEGTLPGGAGTKSAREWSVQSEDARNAAMDAAAYAPEAFASIEDCIAAAVAAGRGVRGTPGATYTFSAGATVTDAPLRIDMTGCNLVRAASGPADTTAALRVVHNLDHATYADAIEVIAVTEVEVNYSAATAPARLSRLQFSAIPAGWAVGDVIRVVSLDRANPGASGSFGNYRMGESAEIWQITGNYVILATLLTMPFSNGIKATRHKNYPVEIIGGNWSDASGYPVARSAPLVSIEGAVQPKISGGTYRDSAAIGTLVAACFEPRISDCRYLRLRHAPSYNARSYGAYSYASTRPSFVNIYGAQCRHVVDTGGAQPDDTAAGEVSLLAYGNTVGMVADGVIGEDGLNAPASTHPDSWFARIRNVDGRHSSARIEDSTHFAGVLLRGVGDEADGVSSVGALAVVAEITCSHSTTKVRRLRATQRMWQSLPVLRVIGTGCTDLAGGAAKARAVLSGLDLDVTNALASQIELRGVDIDMQFDRLRTVAPTQNSGIFHLEATQLRLFGDCYVDTSDSADVQHFLFRLKDSECEVRQTGRLTWRHRDTTTDPVSLGLSLAYMQNTGAKAVFDNVVMSQRPRYGGFRDIGAGAVYSARISVSGAGETEAVRVRTATAGTIDLTTTTGVRFEAGRGESVLHAVLTNEHTGPVNITALPPGTFVRQLLQISNQSATLDFTLAATATNCAVLATRTIAAGTTLTLAWDGAAWR